jgi:hypothetical protein
MNIIAAVLHLAHMDISPSAYQNPNLQEPKTRLMADLRPLSVHLPHRVTLGLAMADLTELGCRPTWPERSPITERTSESKWGARFHWLDVRQEPDNWIPGSTGKETFCYLPC